MTADLAITYLLHGLAFAALLQPNVPRFFAAVCFVCITITHDYFFGHSAGPVYFCTAALADLAVIILIGALRPVTAMVLRLQYLSLISIFLNMMGLALWVFYLPSTAYSVAYVMLYTAAVWSISKRDDGDVGGSTVAWGVPRLPRYHHPGYSYRCPHKGEVST